MEKVEKATPVTRSRLTTSQLTKISALAVMAYVLMFLEFGLPFFPGFLKVDFSDLPALIGAFAMGPVAGILIQLVKNMIHFITKSWSGGVGELANFIVGVFYVVPAALIYHYKKDQKHALIGMLVGTVCMTVLGSTANYFVLIPMYSQFMPLEAIIEMGAVINPRIVDVKTLVLYGIAPFNFFKGMMIAGMTLVLYKRISPLLKK
ncbi:ECF transporter S component [Anoxynatronum buryatiense]|uniref:Riboflavin transporter n=1 Tax=Anoxynatronum buryatiense TaxID=489973 RepID=A0AA45WY27_9CLOT|nr:ECF transporter S component [Anoxynatronum buryatiense]SMP67275.1 Riboflavin transporter FmnP [Anoxynatronum buryatiense]